MKRTLVASVFAPTQRNPIWYDLQLRFLRKTLGDDFDHAVYLNRELPDLFNKSEIIGAVSPGTPFDWYELDVAIAEIISYFELHPGYDSYLILDSDAFPFRFNWLDELHALMAPVPAFGLVQRFIAAPVRAENLDAKPHGCVFFIDGSYLQSVPRGTIRLVTRPGTNLAGMPTDDMFFDATVAVAANGGQTWCPLIRTNVWNPHPIVSAIYANMFYHHGAGSRSPIFRVMQAGIHRHFLSDDDQSAIEERLFAWLASDPETLLDKLTANSALTLAQLSDALS